VLAIMGYHGGVLLTSGGFYSLDAFFALSGFLITSLLVAEWQESGTVRLRRFWARRARRLLPALLLLLLAVLAYATWVALPGMYPGLRGDSIATLFYVANWHFIISGSNYFAQTGATSPLLHTWSLAVEEQFYLVWPLVVLLVLRSRLALRALFAVCVSGAVASAVLMAMLASPSTQNRLYYGTDTRAQSLLVGAALSVALTLAADRRRSASSTEAGAVTSNPAAWRATSRRGRVSSEAFGIIGVVTTAILWTTVAVNNAFAFRGGFFLAACATAGVLANIVVSPDSIVPRCLAFSGLRFLGRISYGLYLWHFPLFLWLDHARTGLTGFPLFLLRLSCTVAIATVSFYGVEKPIRQRRFLKSWRAWVATPVAVLGVTGAVIAATTATVSAAPTRVHLPSNHAGIYAGPPVRVLLVGDSTAATMGIGLSAYEQNYDIKLYNAGILGCGITQGSEYELQGVIAPMDSHCNGSSRSEQWPQVWRNEISDLRPNVVMILAGRWEVTDRTYLGRWTNILQPTYARYVRRQLSLAVNLAGSGGARVMLLTAPCYDTGEQPDGEPWPEDSPQRLAKYNSIVREVAAASPNVTLVNFNAMACPSGHYQTDIDGQQVRYDGVHFTIGGGAVFEPELFPVAARLGHEKT
jgi:peptidoglycan/LPS O-acetylase OafA/YrhL